MDAKGDARTELKCLPAVVDPLCSSIVLYLSGSKTTPKSAGKFYITVSPAGNISAPASASKQIGGQAVSDLRVQF